MGQIKALDSARYIVAHDAEYIFVRKLAVCRPISGMVYFGCLTPELIVDPEEVEAEIRKIIVLPFDEVMPAIRMTMVDCGLTVGKEIGKMMRVN